MVDEGWRRVGLERYPSTYSTATTATTPSIKLSTVNAHHLAFWFPSFQYGRLLALVFLGYEGRRSFVAGAAVTMAGRGNRHDCSGFLPDVPAHVSRSTLECTNSITYCKYPTTGVVTNREKSNPAVPLKRLGKPRRLRSLA